MKHMNIIKRSCALILCLVMCVSYFCVFTVSSAAAEEEKAEVTSKVYPVTDDAYIRKENSGSNYNYETLSSSHGIQFADKKTNVLNVKLHTGNNRNIRTLFKFNLPENSDFDVYELVFNVARIADPLTGDQTYNLYYATDIDWSEKKIENGGNVVKEGVTWNSIASLTPDDDEHLLGSWIVEKGTDQAYMSSENKKVTIDISEKVKGLVESGAKTLTVSIVAQNSMETTAQIHSKESRDGTLGAKLVATKLGGYSRESLENFIQRCETTITDACSEEKIAAFEAALEAAKQVCSDNSASQEDIAASYRSLYKAKTALLIATDTISIAEKDAYIRQDQADKANDCENKDGYKLLNVKESSAHKRHIISLMEFKLPTKEQAEKYGYGTYEFEFHIYSNPDPQNGPQTYNFYYATDLVWEETSVTWNGIRSQVPSDDEHLLADYKIYNNITYSGLSADNKKVVCDITEDIKALIEQGVTSITVFCVAKDDKATSLQFHSGDGDRAFAPKLIATRSAKAPDTTTELIKLEDPNHCQLYYQTREGKNGTVDYRIIVVAKRDWIESLDGKATISGQFVSSNSGNKDFKASITTAYTSIEAVDIDGNTTIYTVDDRCVIMGCVITGVPADFKLNEAALEFITD